MPSLETPSGRLLMFAAVALVTLGALLAIPSLIGLIALLIDGRLTGQVSSAALIAVLCGAILIGGGIMLYRRIVR